jgi:hypothetical protein
MVSSALSEDLLSDDAALPSSEGASLAATLDKNRRGVAFDSATEPHECGSAALISPLVHLVDYRSTEAPFGGLPQNMA